MIAIGALIIGLVCIIATSMTYSLSGGRYPYDYGVVMDAGSSKTNTMVYKWQSNKNKGTGCVSQEDKCQAPGGIAEMDPMELDPVINCAKRVTQHIEPDSRPYTPLYLAATAGMRLLNLTDPDKVESILEQLDNHLNETGLSVKSIEIISGTDEGVYGWITGNFLRKTLEIEIPKVNWAPTTLGALDMGGASMQIAYALPPSDTNHSTSEKRSLLLYGQTHDVFAVSNLCFGRFEAQKRYRSLLIKTPEDSEIEDPCMPSGFVLKNISALDMLDQPCTRNKRNTDWINGGLKIKEKIYTFRGTSDYTKCKEGVAKLLDNTLCSQLQYKECFRRVDSLLDNQKFLAFATYYYTTSFLNLTESTKEEYEKETESFCTKDLADIQQIANNSHVPDYCFNAQYIHEVLIKGFGFNSDTWKNLEFVDKISGKDVGWTLGFMIYATNIIPQKLPLPRLISGASLTVCLVLFTIVVIATAIFLFHSKYKKRSSYPTSTTLYGTP